jgi:putative ABC transport system permease protein
MLLFAKIAFFNMLKHAKRSLVVFLAIMISVTFMIGINAAMTGLTSNLVENVLPSSGHIQIKNRDAKKATNPFDTKYLIDDADGLLSKLIDGRITHKEKILSFGAMVMENQDSDNANEEVRNLGLSGIGIETDSVYYDNIRNGIVKGLFLSGDKDILLSVSVARLLDLDAGDPVMVLTTDADGNPWYQEFFLKGLFTAKSDQIDENMFFLTHAAAESLLNVPGKTREIRISVADYSKADDVRSSVEHVLISYGVLGETWRETYGSLIVIFKLFDIVNILFDTLFVIVSSSVIVNSIVMSLFERIREYGTLRAIGLKRRSLFTMVVSEGAMIGVFGALAGTIVGVSVVAFLNRTGVDIGSATEYLGFGNLFYPVFNPPGIVFAAVCGIVIALLASLYAARVSSKLTITESLTHL